MCHHFEIFDDIELGQFKVIQGQTSWWQSIAHAWFRIVAILEILDIKAIFL